MEFWGWGRSDLAYWHASPSHSVPLDHEDASGNVVFGNALQYLRRAPDDFGVAPIAAAEKYKAWTGGPRQGKEARIIKVGRDHGAALLHRQRDNLRVGRPTQPDSPGMHRIVALGAEPSCQRR